MYVLTGYTKGNAADYFTVNSAITATTSEQLITPIKTIRFACANNGPTAGSEDPLTWSSLVITLSAGTSTGYMLVIGNC